LSSWSRV
jgi:hypothetical protein